MTPDIPQTDAEQVALLPSIITVFNDARSTGLIDLMLYGGSAVVTEALSRVPTADLGLMPTRAEATARLPDRLAPSIRAVEADRYRLMSLMTWDALAEEWMTAKHSRPRVFTRLFNRAMQSALNRGECVDVSGCPFDQATGYTLPEFTEGVDYCDAEREAWIWSVAREDETGVIYASTGIDYYQRQGFTCLFLR